MDKEQIRRHLPTPAQLAPWRVRLGYAVAVVYAIFASPSLPTILLGSMVASMGLLIRGAAAGYLQKNQKLTTAGPYAHTRNPLYFGSSLLALGLLIAGASWIAGIVVALYIAAFYPAVMKFEEGHLRSLHGAAYNDYAAHVPLFFPRLTPAPVLQNDTPFSWQLYRANREYQAAIGAAVAIALLAAKMIFF